MTNSPLPNLERVLRIAVAALALAVAILANVRAYAEPTEERLRWERVAVVESVAITVHVVGVDELARMQGKPWQNYRDLRKSHRHGFARLYRNAATGAYTCAVYVTRETNTPAALEHETRHCNGWVHP